ncbi:MAG: thioredoxin family protein [Succinivibrionaceae bacterium]|nr:thioredoxin family protein [Succinivibrionaceae bacterium]
MKNAVPALLLALLLPLQPATAGGDEDLFRLRLGGLPAAELPFAVDSGTRGSAVWVTISPAGGAYLYRSSIQVESAAQVMVDPLPPGTLHEGLEGPEEIFTEPVTVRASVLASTGGEELAVTYQGCDSAGICYPPQRHTLALPRVEATADALGAAPPQAQGSGGGEPDFLGYLRDRPALALLMAILLGAALDLTPCVLPMLGIFSVMIMGKRGLPPRESLRQNLSYLLGLSLTYALLGCLAASLGFLGRAYLQHPLLLGTMALLLALCALICAGVLEFPIPQRANNYLNSLLGRLRKGTMLGALALGALSAIIATPCTSAPLAGALMYVMETGDIALGTAALFCIGLGMGLPLVLIGLFGNRILPRSGPWSSLVKQAMAIPLWWAAHAVALPLMGDLAPLATALSIALTLGFAAYLLAALSPLGRRGAIALGVVAAVAALPFLGLGASPARLPEGITAITSISDLESQSSAPRLLTFSAQWCANCHAMDGEVYSSPRFRSQIGDTKLLRIDVTDPDAPLTRAAVERFGLLGVPTAIMIDAHGQPLRAKVGTATAEEMASFARGE